LYVIAEACGSNPRLLLQNTVAIFIFLISLHYSYIFWPSSTSSKSISPSATRDINSISWWTWRTNKNLLRSQFWKKVLEKNIAYLISVGEFELLDLSNNKSKWCDESAFLFTFRWNDGNLEEKHWCIRILIKINSKTSYWSKSNGFKDDEHDVLVTAITN
jgi:hypothetical protein